MTTHVCSRCGEEWEQHSGNPTILCPDCQKQPEPELPDGLGHACFGCGGRVFMDDAMGVSRCVWCGTPYDDPEEKIYAADPR